MNIQDVGVEPLKLKCGHTEGEEHNSNCMLTISDEERMEKAREILMATSKILDEILERGE